MSIASSEVEGSIVGFDQKGTDPALSADASEHGAPQMVPTVHHLESISIEQSEAAIHVAGQVLTAADMAEAVGLAARGSAVV